MGEKIEKFACGAVGHNWYEMRHRFFSCFLKKEGSTTNEMIR